MKIILRRFIARYFGWSVELLVTLSLKFISFKKPPVIILTFGKVGSSSVYETLKRELSNPVFHLHNFTDKSIKKGINLHIQSDRKSIPLHLRVSNVLHKKLKNYENKLYVITILREPISREISAFFQNSEFYKNSIEGPGLMINLDAAMPILNNVINGGMTKKLENWIDEELVDGLGINVYEKSSFSDKKFQIFHSKKCELLLLKMEDLDQVFNEAINNLLQTNLNIELLKSNIGGSKHYSRVYKKAKNLVELKAETKRELLSSKYMNSFYKNEVF